MLLAHLRNQTAQLLDFPHLGRPKMGLVRASVERRDGNDLINEGAAHTPVDLVAIAFR